MIRATSREGFLNVAKNTAAQAIDNTSSFTKTGYLVTAEEIALIDGRNLC